MANPKPPSSATPATNARLPVRSMASMGFLGYRRFSYRQSAIGYQLSAIGYPLNG
jgi:hypothetical protein